MISRIIFRAAWGQSAGFCACSVSGLNAAQLEFDVSHYVNDHLTGWDFTWVHWKRWDLCSLLHPLLELLTHLNDSYIAISTCTESLSVFSRLSWCISIKATPSRFLFEKRSIYNLFFWLSDIAFSYICTKSYVYYQTDYIQICCFWKRSRSPYHLIEAQVLGNHSFAVDCSWWAA